MIFICIFVTISLSFCNSVFIKRTSNTHLLVLSYVEMDAFKEKWVDELPNEMITQHSSICQLLIEPLIILDELTLPIKYLYSIYYSFESRIDYIPPLKEHMDTPFWFEKNGHRIHLLPCRRKKQTIYITKADEYESYIMLVNAHYVPDNFEFHILGFIMKFAQLNPIGGNLLELFYDEFRNHIINEKKEKRRIYSIEVYYSSTFEYRLQSFRLCTSVLRKLLIGIHIGIHANSLYVKYQQKDFSIAPKTCSRLSFLRLKVIECKINSFIFNLVKRTSNELFVTYEMNNRKIIELYKTEDMDTIILIESAFAYVVNK